jgi:hypothetical protein
VDQAGVCSPAPAAGCTYTLAFAAAVTLA